mgnify:CR=1 FL=1
MLFRSIIEAITASGGMVHHAAKSLGVSPQAIYKRAKKNPEITEAITNTRELITDMAETKLIQAIRDGKSWAIMFYLKCMAKDRGYVERQEVGGVDGGPVKLTVVYEDQK